MPDPANTFLPVSSESPDGEEDVKIILLSGFSDKQLHDLIDAYRKNPNFPKAIFATVTDSSKEFKLKDLLSELKTEAEQLNRTREKKG